MNPFEDLEKANLLYKEQKFPLAAQAYSKIATDLYILNESSELGEIAMKMAIDSYHKTLTENQLHQLSRDTNGNLFLQFFSIRRFLEDHLIEKDAAKIDKIINKNFQPNQAERIFYYEGEIIATEPNKIITNSSKVGPYHSSTISAQGPREKLEDFFLHGDFVMKNGLNIPFFAILDGHAGVNCAKFVRTQIKQILPELLETENDLAIYNSLHQICVSIDDNWKDYVLRPAAKLRDRSGTTLLFALIIKNILWIVSVGDSRAVLGKNGEAIQLSEDAKPSIEKYQMEIMRRGGYVRWRRVDGSLDMARSIGDIEHPSVSARPCIRKFDLATLDSEKTNFLILATDGLWDVIGSRDAVNLCSGLQTAKSMAEKLVSAAYGNGSLDNVTVMVIKL